MPPEDLRWRAAGMRDAESFLASGRTAVEFFDREALASERKSLGDFSMILDFGCGCGRLLRTLRTVCDQWAAIHGTDIDPSAITWCKQNIAEASYVVNAEYPPLPYRGPFDRPGPGELGVQPPRCRSPGRWLAELQRVVKPGRSAVEEPFADGTPSSRSPTMPNATPSSPTSTATASSYRRSDAWRGIFRPGMARPITRRITCSAHGAAISKSAKSSRPARSPRTRRFSGRANRPSCSACSSGRDVGSAPLRLFGTRRDSRSICHRVTSQGAPSGCFCCAFPKFVTL